VVLLLVKIVEWFFYSEFSELDFIVINAGKKTVRVKQEYPYNSPVIKRKALEFPTPCSETI
jgi:hypothetical protein